MSEWIRMSERTPDAKNHEVLVFCPRGLNSDYEIPAMHILFWYKCNFGDGDIDINQISYWMEIPEVPNV
jgi:hypothetical protein